MIVARNVSFISCADWLSLLNKGTWLFDLCTYDTRVTRADESKSG